MDFIKREPDRVTLWLPSKGRLKEHVIHYLHGKWYEVQEFPDRTLQTTLNDQRFKVCFMHAKDIPVMLEKKLIDIWFTGIDLIHETKCHAIRQVIKTGLWIVKMVIAVPLDSQIKHPYELMWKTIATSFENIAWAYFKSIKVDVNIYKIHWASEWMPYLHLCDGIMDVVETWSSIKANKLKIICDDIFASELVVGVHHPEFQENYPLINEFLTKLYH